MELNEKEKAPENGKKSKITVDYSKLKKNDGVKYIGIALLFASWFALLGFLCWHFDSIWPCLLIFFSPRVDD